MTARTNDLECWKLFCLVVEKQGLNAAADFADIEPSRLSRVINSLEAELGSPLLVHNRRPLQTTSFGDQAYAMAKALLAQHALMLETLKDDKDRMEGLITLAIPAGIGPLFVTPQLLEFQQIFPKIESELITLTSKAEEVFYNHPEKVVHVSIGFRCECDELRFCFHRLRSSGNRRHCFPLLRKNGIHTLLLTKLY